MKGFFKAAVIILLTGMLFGSAARDVRAQGKARGTAQAIITAARIEKSADRFYWPLYVTIGGKERKIADEAFDVWIIEGGRRVVYSGHEGTGGFENEGQSLHIYDPQTRTKRRIMSESVMVDKVTAVMTSRKKTALLVKMSDGGLGASYLAVVDPSRGEVFFRKWAKVLALRGDVLSIAHYTMEDMSTLAENESAVVKPYKIERQNLNAILRGRVIVNKPDYP